MIIQPHTGPVTLHKRMVVTLINSWFGKCVLANIVTIALTQSSMGSESLVKLLLLIFMERQV